MASESKETARVFTGWEDWPEIKKRPKPSGAEEEGTRQENDSESMKKPQIEVEIRQSGKPGATKAYADIRLNFPDGELRIIGFGIIKQPGKSSWIGFSGKSWPEQIFPDRSGEGTHA